MDRGERERRQELLEAAQGGHEPPDRESRRRAACPDAVVERPARLKRPTERKDEAMAPNPDRVLIFDTTLRDGEQSPGCSMTQPEKLRVARSLADLGVDVIEAGFPAASRGDWESVNAVAREVPGSIICGLARCNRDDIDLAAKARGERPH